MCTLSIAIRRGRRGMRRSRWWDGAPNGMWDRPRRPPSRDACWLTARYLLAGAGSLEGVNTGTYGSHFRFAKA
ncbi:hypothetical protein GCM10009579_32600 [Streptomyces javensis]|uniref:Uncharacterized protein n=1 Tax=Streptomyces javensis TaxID=114698 RepID=A0ABN1X1N8_9ACTN